MSTINRSFSTGEIFHICNKSISNYDIFRNEKLLNRFLLTINYYNNIELKISLSRALRTKLYLPNIFFRANENIIYILAFCIMPDHYHLLVKINNQYTFSKYINNLESRYTRYYNKLNHRKGPLWQSRFRAAHISSNRTLLHVHRYIHLNPTTARIVEKPEDWKWSSYDSYIHDKKVLQLNREISIKSTFEYKKFVEKNIDYQRAIKNIRNKLLD
ncbi:MAG: transposase [Candidatus Roizmanbacteria bacterium]|nr:transposase [Candidatus Roizmanbacteria bacterium]